MMKLNNAVLHILDFSSGMAIFSEKELDVSNRNICIYLEKHIEKAYKDLSLKNGVFYEESKFKRSFLEYIDKNMSFIEFSNYIAGIVYETILNSDDCASQDLIVCDFSFEDENILGILICNNKIGFIHHVTNEDSIVKNEIINHYAILPNIKQKFDEYIFVSARTFDVKYLSKKRYIDGDDINMIPDILLECSSSISQKDTLKLVNSISQKIAENHGRNSIETITKVKNFIVENGEISDYIEPIELSKEVFMNEPDMQEEFLLETKNAGIPEKVVIDRSFAVKVNRNHKIKTDTGIELTFPSDYFENKNYIDFINNPDGTISIEIKNIGKIFNK